MYSYRTSGTCSRQIDFELDGETITYVKFFGGCNGNLQGITKLITGANARDIISMLKGIRCGLRETSCPDQLSKALEQALAHQE